MKPSGKSKKEEKERTTAPTPTETSDRPEDAGHRPEGGDGEPGEDQDREKRTDVRSSDGRSTGR